jgi:hypothetical protein
MDSKCKEITFCAKELLRTHHIHIEETNKKEVVVLLSNYIDLLIFNIVAVISIICANIGVKKVISQHIQHLSKYIDKRCLNSRKAASGVSGKKGMSGGAFNTAAFYGVAEPQYSASHEGANIQNIDFTGGIARNALGMTGGGSSGSNGGSACAKLDKIILKKIRDVFKFFNMKVDKEAIVHIKAKYDTIIKDLYECIKKIKGDITASKVASVIKKSKIMKKN